VLDLGERLFRHQVVRGEDGRDVRAAVKEPTRPVVGVWSVRRLLEQPRVEPHAEPLKGGPVAVEPFRPGRPVHLTEQQADPPMPQLEQVGRGGVRAGGVLEHHRIACPGDHLAVDLDDGHPGVDEPPGDR
jgi:hypothetical protein